jgi:hypothetical protein
MADVSSSSNLTGLARAMVNHGWLTETGSGNVPASQAILS